MQPFEVFRASDGALIHYRDEGAGSPFVLLHGWGAHGEFFAPQRAALAASHRVITPDLRGCGASARSGSCASATITRLGADVAELSRDLALEGAIGIGWSMGAMVLWSAVLDHGAQFEGVVVVDMSPRVSTDAGWSMGLKGGHDLSAVTRAVEAIGADWGAFRRRFAERLFAEGEDRSELTAWAERAAAIGDPARLAPLWGSMAAADFRHRLGALGAPTLIVHGAESQLYEAAASEALAGLLPQARRIAYASSGHAPHLEEPARFNDDIINFAAALQRTGKIPDTAQASRRSMEGGKQS